MSQLVHCLKYKKDLPGLEEAPFPGETGAYILKNISAQAWEEWLAHQTMLLNEHRLNPLDRSTKTFLKEQMLLFFSGEAKKPEGFVER